MNGKSKANRQVNNMAMKYTKTYVDWAQVPLVMSVSEACILLRVSDATVRNFLTSGKLKGTQTDGKWLITKDSMLKFLGVS